MTTILLFLAVLFVLVLVHEWGHYIVAKMTGMRVDEFAIGFPPRLLGVRRGETEYTLNALPLGGFVRIFGESLVHEEGEEAHPDRARAMWARPKWAQALVLVAGVVMNIVLAWALYVAVFMIGVPTQVPDGQVVPGSQLYVAEVLSGGPLSGEVLPGSMIVGAKAGDDELSVLTPTTFTEFVTSHSEVPIEISFKTDDTVRSVLVTPVSGLITSDPERKAVGVALAQVVTERHGIFGAIVEASKTTVSGLFTITAGVGSLISGLVTGGADLSQVAGPVGIAGMVGDAATIGITALFSFVAIISLNLAVINLLPFPALDGGRLLLLLGEVVFRRPANEVWVNRLNTAGFILLITFMLFVTYQDIARIFAA